ncbi:MAG: DUF2142 domain-containing protein [Pseudomonadota bacterium]
MSMDVERRDYGSSPAFEEADVEARTNNGLNKLNRSRADRIRAYFVVAFTLIFAGYIAIILPPFQIVDEDEHLKRAYSFTAGAVLLSTEPDRSTGVMADQSLLRFIDEFHHYRGNVNARLTEEQWDRASGTLWAGEETYVEAPGTGYYFPLIYLPQTAALKIGLLTDLSVSQSYMLAKFAALITGCAMLLYSIRFAPPPTPALAILLMPMTLYQASSTGIDFVSIAATVLIVSMFVSSITNPTRWSAGRVALFVILILIVATSRLHMGVLLMLPALMYWRLRDGRLALSFAALTSFTAVWYAVAIPSTVDLRRSDVTPTTEIILYYIQNPLELPSVIIATILDEGRRTTILQSFVGKLGWWDTNQSLYGYIAATLILLLIAAISLRRPSQLMDWSAQAWLILLGAASIVLGFISMLIAWSPHPAEFIEGVQGRYFIPSAILILYATFYPMTGTNQNPRLESAKSVALMVFAALSALWVFQFVYARYYFDGIFY